VIFRNSHAPPAVDFARREFIERGASWPGSRLQTALDQPPTNDLLADVAEFDLSRSCVQLAVLRRARFGRSSEKLDREIEQLEFVLGELEESVAESNARNRAGQAGSCGWGNAACSLHSAGPVLFDIVDLLAHHSS
jgi:Transposase C of IS166 homeodomain